ncbi:phage protein, HK97 gp10 family [Devosia crocina]|uniref:Phage protein, HK97 gp10 family n=1 Tax=Devosia crocina TaxID=429728 RepID=A0A1I7NEV7_9HYPH|nr:HK97-gp10 family putative phage morphogenesis protein [Devosia crocina]SFV33179.1 phage protein, HK97 gp10 family [Devosia crocina]
MATKIIGLDRLKKKLRRLPGAVEAEIRKAMEQTANEVVAMAKSLVPVSPGGGTLRDSIGWTYGDAPVGAMTLGKVKSGRASGDLVITVYAGGGDAFYARFVEFGTAPHLNKGRFAGSEHPGTAAQPFFYPSWRANRRKGRGRVSRAITKAAKRVAAGN